MDHNQVQEAGMVNIISDLYRKRIKRSYLWLVILLLITAAITIYSICVTQYHIAFGRALEILINNINGIEPIDYWDRLETSIVCDSLVPRAIGAVIVGAVLGISGTVMQSIVRNPIADPYTTGISSGALLGVTVSVVLGIDLLPIMDSSISLMGTAFLFALIPCFIVMIMSARHKVTSTMMVLIGVAVMYMFNAISTLLRYTSTDEKIAEIFNWTVGVLGRVHWESLPVLLAALVLLILFSYFQHRMLNILSADDRLCVSLGINPQRMRLISMAVVAVATAIAVCYVGTIGFVGLVAPHIARMFVGSNHAILLPASAVIGAFILIAADCIARVATPTGLPVGVITSLVGGPIFLYILVRQKKSAWGRK